MKKKLAFDQLHTVDPRTAEWVDARKRVRPLHAMSRLQGVDRHALP